jgi:hypothetical protein
MPLDPLTTIVAAKTVTAALDADALKQLERELTIAVEQQKPKTGFRPRERRDRGSGEGEPNEPHREALNRDPAAPELDPGARLPSERSAEPRLDLEEIASECLEEAKSGVEIASQAESTPLIPLLQAAEVKPSPEVKVAHELQRYDFYLVEVTFSILLDRDEYARSAALELTISDDVAQAERRVRPIQLFPARKDRELFRVDLEGGVGIDAGFNLSVPLEALAAAVPTVLPFAKLDAGLKAKAGIVVGPVSFPFRKAAVEVKGSSSQEVAWRYNLQSELMGTNEFKSLLVLKVPQEARRVKMDLRLGVKPGKRRWRILGNDPIPELSDHASLGVELLTRFDR